MIIEGGREGGREIEREREGRREGEKDFIYHLEKFKLTNEDEHSGKLGSFMVAYSPVCTLLMVVEA